MARTVEIHRVEFYVNCWKLCGNLHLPYIGAPCIVALHGLESDKDSGKWPLIASRLSSEGFACLRFNFRGCGEGLDKSDGLFEDTCLTSRIEDYRAALRFIQECGKVDAERIGVVGSSFGGMVAIAARDKRVKAIAAISTPYKISGLGEPHLAPGGDIYYVLPSGRKLKAKFYEDLEKYDLLDAVKEAPPIIIIHGSVDELIPVEHALKLYEAVSGPKRIEIIEGADHRFTGTDHLNRAINLVIEWFREHL